jgi:hypothetical protein
MKHGYVQSTFFMSCILILHELLAIPAYCSLLWIRLKTPIFPIISLSQFSRAKQNTVEWLGIQEIKHLLSATFLTKNSKQRASRGVKEWHYTSFGTQMSCCHSPVLWAMWWWQSRVGAIFSSCTSNKSLRCNQNKWTSCGTNDFYTFHNHH